ncbi:MAG: Holliday junction branch migration protein RuvA [Fretibacterium sp.]|nr:Holliday junction branch migration protein RuvA [Fretibacterium sp.]
MIRSLNGEVLSVGSGAAGSPANTSVLLDVNGLGFDVLCSRAAAGLCRVGETVRLTVYLQISEAGVALYGFASERERELFLKVTAIKGVGGRTGMAILSTLSVDEVLRAVSLADAAAFTRVPGIGKKTAERLCFELRNLLPEGLADSVPAAGQAALSSKAADTVAEALLSLGFPQADVSSVLALLRAAQGEDFDRMDEEKLLKLALRELHSASRRERADRGGR